MPSITGLNVCMIPPSILAIGSSRSGSSGSGTRVGRQAARQRSGQGLEQAPVRVERPLHPRPAGHGLDDETAARRRRGQRRRVGHLELGHAGELLELDAIDRVDVRLGARPRWRWTRPAGGRRPSSPGPAAAASGPGRRTRGCRGTGHLPPDRVDRNRSRWHGRAMSTIVLSGSTDALGRRVRARLDATDGVERVIEVGHDDASDDHHAQARRDLKASLEGASAVIQLGGDADETATLLDAAVGHRRRRRSCCCPARPCTARGPSNPVPLTEDAPLRPERRARVRRASSRARTARGRVALGPPRRDGRDPAARDPRGGGRPGWLAAAMRTTAAVRPVGSDDPPLQYVHLDDLADAIVLACRATPRRAIQRRPRRMDRPDDELRALAGVPRLSLPDPLARRVAWTRWRVGLSPTQPGLLPYTMHPWVIANDRLKAAGWHRRRRTRRPTSRGTGPRHGRRSARSAARSSRSARPASP